MELLAIDIETANWGHIAEFGCVSIANGKLVNPYSWYIKPACYPSFDAEHQSVNKIDISLLADAPTFDELWKNELKHVIRPDVLLIGHNVLFDVNCLCTEMDRYKIKRHVMRYFCTLEQSRKWLKGLDSYTLSNVCRFLNIEMKQAHRACFDAEASARIFCKLPKTHKGCIKYKNI